MTLFAFSFYRHLDPTVLALEMLLYTFTNMTALLFRLHHYTVELLSHWEDKSELIGDIS